MTELPTTAAGALLRRLAVLDVDLVVTNSGTDFPPLIEALAEARAGGVDVPEMLVVPHEHVAMGMAHGYAAATGRPAAVVLHTNVGLANGAIGAINAATDRVPMLVMSGRTPTTEQGRLGSRTVPIGWGQEMRDQTALVREACKWDYELRFPEQVPELLDRAHAIATSSPTGPVYLSLPREVLAQPCPAEALAPPVTMRPAGTRASADQVDRLARLLLDAQHPLVISQRGAGSVEGFAALAELADRWAVPVCEYWAVATSIAADHPMAVGPDPGPWLERADVVLVLDSLAPWSPDAHRPREDGTVVQLGPDPLFERVPVRNFRSDLSIRGEVGPALVDLLGAMDRLDDHASTDARDARRTEVAAHTRRWRTGVDEDARAGDGTPPTKAWVSRCLGQALEGRRATVVSELGCPLPPLGLRDHDAWRQEPHSGGLGWSLPYAMGRRLAAPDHLAVATMGDGSYLFANPVACHQVAHRHGIGVLAVVLNNGRYEAVRASVLEQYPDGYAAKADTVPLVDITVGGSLAAVARACGAHAEHVGSGADVPAALARAIAHVDDTGGQALVEVTVS